MRLRSSSMRNRIPTGFGCRVFYRPFAKAHFPSNCSIEQRTNSEGSVRLVGRDSVEPNLMSHRDTRIGRSTGAS